MAGLRLQNQINEFTRDLDKQRDRIEWLTAGTPYCIMEPSPDYDVLGNIKKEWEDTDFWQNFHEIAPVLFCFAAEKDAELQELRDQSITNEILKTRTLLNQIKINISEKEPESLNMYHLSYSLKSLQIKIDILKALKSPSSDEWGLKMPIAGTNKNLIINFSKMLDAITIETIPTEKEKLEEKLANKKSKKQNKIKVNIMPEDHLFLSQRIEDFQIGFLPNKLLDKESTLKTMKLIGELARSKTHVKLEQEERLKFYGNDDVMYIDTIKQSLEKETANYEYCQKAVLCKLNISEELFLSSEREVSCDPFIQQELINSEVNYDKEQSEISELLTKDKINGIINKANEVAYGKFLKLKKQGIHIEHSMSPVVISCLSFDYILTAYGYDQEIFKLTT